MAPNTSRRARSLLTARAVSAFIVLALAAPAAPAADVRLAEDGAMTVDGKRVFPITLTLPPPPDALSPRGSPAFAEFRDAGVLMVRTGPTGGRGRWDDASLDTEQAYMDAAAKHGILCAPWLRELAELKPQQAAREQKLVEIVDRFKAHPAMGVWKGADEPEWGKVPAEDCLRAYAAVKRRDPHRPVWIVQAPRGTVDSLKAYRAVFDVGGTDIYPIGYPPGTHSLEANKEISMVGDFAARTRAFCDGKPFWMTLQIAWSGVSKPGKTLRMPTFPQLRYMTYQSIVHGARGVVYFGGHVPQAWDERDARLQWNWRFWDRVLRPVVEEIGPRGPLAAALVAPDGGAPLTVDPPGAVEFTVRQTADATYLIACRREGETVKVTFAGLPPDAGAGTVLFEEPRTVRADGGRLTDWFAPFDVHVYRFATAAKRAAAATDDAAKR